MVWPSVVVASMVASFVLPLMMLVASMVVGFVVLCLVLVLVLVEGDTLLVVFGWQGQNLLVVFCVLVDFGVGCMVLLPLMLCLLLYAHAE